MKGISLSFTFIRECYGPTLNIYRRDEIEFICHSSKELFCELRPEVKRNFISIPHANDNYNRQP
jgi:hypothetical protein